MRKWTVWALVCLLLVCAIPASAEGLDLAAMSTDELIALRKSVDAEIAERTAVDLNAIYKGIYVVGENIAPGSYMITCTAADDDKMSIELFASQDEYKENDKLNWTRLYVGESAIFYLSDGMVIEIDDGIGDMQIANQAWMNEEQKAGE